MGPSANGASAKPGLLSARCARSDTILRRLRTFRLARSCCIEHAPRTITARPANPGPRHRFIGGPATYVAYDRDRAFPNPLSELRRVAPAVSLAAAAALADLQPDRFPGTHAAGARLVAAIRRRRRPGRLRPRPIDRRARRAGTSGAAAMTQPAFLTDPALCQVWDVLPEARVVGG